MFSYKLTEEFGIGGFNGRYLMPSCDAQLTLAPRDSNKRAICRLPLTQHSCSGV